MRTYHQIRDLLENGASVTVLCPVEDERDLAHCAELQDKHANLIVRGCQVWPRFLRYLRAGFLNRSVSESIFYSPLLRKELDAILARESFDFVICTASSMAPYIFECSWLDAHPIKVIMDFMDLDSRKWEQYATGASIPMRLVYRREAQKVARLERLVAERFFAALFVSESETRLFRSAQPVAHCQIMTVGNGIEPGEFSPPQTPQNFSSPRLLFAGVMDYAPNVDAVLWFYRAVWPSVLARWPDALFTIAGMNPASAIRALAADDAIEVTGYVNDILPYFHQASVFVAPFRIARGVQNKILQAMACGVPVVSTSMGAEGIDGENGVNLLIADSAKDFLHAVASLVDNPLRYERLRGAALGTIQRRYSWSGQLAPFRQLLGLSARQTAGQSHDGAPGNAVCQAG